MISLYIDTSLERLRIAIVKDNEILSKQEGDTPNMHSVYATSFIKKALDEAGIDANDIDKIMVVNGPGSFTGVRIGVTIAKTYGFLIKKDVTPVSSLKSMAISLEHDGNVMCLISARRNNYYMGLYDKDNNEIVPETFADDKRIMDLVKEYNPVLVGNDYNVLGTIKVDKALIDILKITDYYMDKESINPHKLVPNYLKLPQVYENDKRD